MKKLSYLFALIGLFVFASCGNSSNQATEATVEENKDTSTDQQKSEVQSSKKK